jgi:hypothetical protein
VKNSKEVERSLWSGIGASVNSHEVVGAKRGVVDVAIRERTMVLPAHRVLSEEDKEEKLERETYYLLKIQFSSQYAHMKD